MQIISDKGLISTLYKEFLKLNENNNNLKMGKGPEQTFLQRRYTKGQQVHEKMLNITIIREMQIKTMRHHLMPVRLAITEEMSDNKC